MPQQKNYVDEHIVATRTYVDDQAAVTRSHAVTKNYVDEQVVATKSYVDSQDVATKSYVDEQVVTTRTYVDEQVVATKNYVESLVRRSYVGFIPNLEANESVTGFVASASSTHNERPAYAAFNKLMSAWVSNETETAWLQIKCPRLVTIWRIALGLIMRSAVVNLSASRDAVEFTTIIMTQVAGSDKFFTITPSTPYRFYRVTLTNIPDSTELLGLVSMQIYEYLT